MSYLHDFFIIFSLDAVEDKVWPDTNSICQAPYIIRYHDIPFLRAAFLYLGLGSIHCFSAKSTQLMR